MKSVLLAIALCVFSTHAVASPTLSFGSYGRVSLAAAAARLTRPYEPKDKVGDATA